MTKKTRKRGEIDNDPFRILPLDLLVEILLKLQVKSIAKLIFVSKHWSSIIRSKDFIKLYMTRSSNRPRLLFLYRTPRSQLLQSCSLEDPSSDHQRVFITTHNLGQNCEFSAPVRGLICLQNDTKVMIGNISTSQFLTLPKVKTNRKDLFSFFGYDSVNDVYKVLCMTVQSRISPVVSDEHQVFTLGPKQKWRKIACKHPHLPLRATTKGICINGIVYYYARIEKKGSLVCFDLTSEDFDVVELPEDIQNLFNYGGGKIALWNRGYGGTVNLFLLQDAKKQNWSKVCHLVPSVVSRLPFSFGGILSTGQLIFIPYPCSSSNPYIFISDLKENNVKKVVFEGTEDFYPFIERCFNFVENPMVLSSVS